MEMKPIALSFKNTEEDRKLYKWIISHSGKSAFIKDTLREVMNGNCKEIKKDNELIDLGDF